MNIAFLLREDVQDFIRKNEKTVPTTLMLQAKRYPEWPMAEVVQQVQGLNKARLKLPGWHDQSGIIYPAPVSMEQCSSERAAVFKASLVYGSSLVDLTGGLGVDDWAFAKKFITVTYLERQPQLAEIAAHNFKVLGAENIEVISANALDWLDTSPVPVDVIYLDPARRGGQQERVQRLQDCEPNVLELLPKLLKTADRILLKTAPLLDITQAVKDLAKVEKVWAVAVNGEVKEVLYLLGPNLSETPELMAVDLKTANEPVLFQTSALKEAESVVTYSEPKRFLYEPNAAVLKIGAFRSVGTSFQVNKLHPSSHLYTSEKFVEGFPGRSFELLSSCRYNARELKAAIPDGKANLTVRNFPETVAQIRKKTGMKEGGELYLFATTDFQNKHVILICRKVKL